MSTETDAQALTGKAKKAKRSEERYKKNKKKSSSSSSSSKKEGDTTESTTTTADGDHAQEKDKDMTADANVKQDKKRKRSEEEKTTTPCSEETPAEGGQQKKQKKPKTDKAAAKQGSQEDSAAAAAAKPQRFICFIGNLPFTATTAGITEHFASIQPVSIRHSTEKGTDKSKGFAFLEFADYDRMKTCLKKFHHSMFDSGVGGERGQRRINVELTAGGGGNKSEGRKEKLQVKNVRLNEQRARRAEAEAKQEKRKEAKEAKKGGAKEEQVAAPKAGGGGDAAAQEGIHPARLAMLNKINNRY